MMVLTKGTYYSPHSNQKPTSIHVWKDTLSPYIQTLKTQEKEKHNQFKRFSKKKKRATKGTGNPQMLEWL